MIKAIGKKMCLLIPALCAGLAYAQDRSVKTVTTSEFDKPAVAQLNPATLYYSENIQSFDDWKKQSPAEKSVLSLYAGYEEPTVTYKVKNERKQRVEKLTMYVAKTRTVLNVPAAQVNLAGMINLDNIKKLDSEIIHQPIHKNQFMSEEAGKTAINNFQWCNKGKQYITRVKNEIDLAHLNPKDRDWCDNAQRSTCVESCFLFGTAWSAGVSLANAAISDEGEKKDYGLAMQSEIRYFTSEAEYGQKVPLSQLTHIDTPVRGVVEQNIFYINQVFQYGKIVAILQEDPNDSHRTVMTGFVVMGIRTRSWKKYPIIPDVLSGTSAINTRTGITAGIPTFTQNMTKAIARVLESKTS